MGIIMKKLTDESESDRNVCDDEESNNEGIDKIERVGQCSFWDKTSTIIRFKTFCLTDVG